MNLKNLLSILVLSGSLAIATVSCKSKVSDADLRAKVENSISNNSGVTVDVKDGVVTLSGTVATEDERMAIENSVKAADSKGVKSVVNNIVVHAPQIDINSNDADLKAKVVDATKDFPSISATVNEGVITVTGTIEQARVQVLKQSLDALSPKKVDMTALVVK